MTTNPREGRVVVTPRKAYGRKRSGGGYIGRHKRAKPTGPPKVEPWMIRFCEQFAGPEWRTVREISEQLGGMAPNIVRSRICLIRRAAPPGFEVSRSLAAGNMQSDFACSNRGGVNDPGRKGFRPVYFRIERTNENASE